MRVLDTTTGHFVEIDPKDRKFKYAILSHTWRPEGEQTFQRLRAIQSDEYSLSYDDPPPDSTPGKPLKHIWAHPKLSSKIREACRVARENGYRYLWIDSCCIDKTSSSELSESINSMYQWYSLADICYAFLADVPAEEDHKAEGSCFRHNRWFTRAWTLQELIAPFRVVFLAQDWSVIGSKFILGDLISEITKIDYDALLRVEPLEEFSVAQRFSWAAERKATRMEDRAYSLLGIFDINMPTLYGEGERAFRRLQEEIMRRSPDQSLFAWTDWGLPCSLSNSLLYDPETTLIADYKQHPLLFCAGSASSLLAPSLDVFKLCEGIKAVAHDEVLRRLHLPADALSTRHYEFTPYGVRLQLPVIHFETSEYFPPGCVDSKEWLLNNVPFSDWYLVVLGCEHRKVPGRLLGRICYVRSSGASVDFLYSGHILDRQGSGVHSSNSLLLVSPETIARLHTSHISPKTLYIPQPPRRDEGTTRRDRYNLEHSTIHLILPKKNRHALSAQGYMTTLRGPDDVRPITQSITLAHDTHTIAIDYRHNISTSHRGYQVLGVEAHVKISISQANSPQSQGTVVSWGDHAPWNDSLETRDVPLEIPQGSRLSLGLAFFTTDHYVLSIQLRPRVGQTAVTPALESSPSCAVGGARSSGVQVAQVRVTHRDPSRVTAVPREIPGP